MIDGILIKFAVLSNLLTDGYELLVLVQLLKPLSRYTLGIHLRYTHTHICIYPHYVPELSSRCPTKKRHFQAIT